MEDAEEPGTGGAGKAGNRRRRPPVTIDLEAESIGGPVRESADVPASEEAGGAQATVDVDAETVTPAAAAAPPSAAPDDDAESEAIDRRRAGAARYLPVVAAAILGGIAGGVVTAFLLAPPTDTINQATVDSRFAAFDARIGRVETAVKDLPAPTAPPADDGRVAAIESELQSLKAAIAALPAPAAGAPSGAAPDLAPIEVRIAALESRPATAEAPAVDLAPLDARVAELQKRLDQLEAHPPADPRTEAAARTIALTSLRQAAAAGGPFAAELAAYVNLGGDGAALAPLAEAGAPSLAALQAEFPPLAVQIRRAAAKVDPSASMWDRLVASAGSLVEVKPAGPVEGSSAVAVLSRVEAAVAAGDLSTALREADGFDASGREAIAAWRTAAERRLAIDAAVAALPPAGSSG